MDNAPGGPPAGNSTSISGFLERVVAARGYRGQIVHVEEIASRDPAFVAPRTPLSEPILAALRSLGISSLYAHQAAAIDRVAEGKNVAIVTSTASGKTICYNIPVLEALLADKDSTALYLFPTKALAQDQLRGLGSLCGSDPSLAGLIHAGTYDGDTPGETRRKLRNEAKVL